MVHPTISSVSPTVGSTGGTDVVITGTGFDINAANNVVNVAGARCLITSVTQTEIRCRTVQTSSNYDSGRILNASLVRTNPYI